MNIEFITSDIESLKRVLKNGCRWVRFEPKAGKEDEVTEAVRLCRESEAVIIVDGDATLCEAAKADGIHVAAVEEVGMVRRALGEEPLIGVNACDLASVKTARANGADYIVAGAFEDNTPEGLRELVRNLYEADIPLPVSIGGAVTPDDLPTIAATGVRGVSTRDEAFFQKDIWQFIDRIS